MFFSLINVRIFYHIIHVKILVDIFTNVWLFFVSYKILFSNNSIMLISNKKKTHKLQQIKQSPSKPDIKKIYQIAHLFEKGLQPCVYSRAGELNKKKFTQKKFFFFFYFFPTFFSFFI